MATEVTKQVRQGLAENVWLLLTLSFTCSLGIDDFVRRELHKKNPAGGKISIHLTCKPCFQPESENRS